MAPILAFQLMIGDLGGRCVAVAGRIAAVCVFVRLSRVSSSASVGGGLNGSRLSGFL